MSKSHWYQGETPNFHLFIILLCIPYVGCNFPPMQRVAPSHNVWVDLVRSWISGNIWIVAAIDHFCHGPREFIFRERGEMGEEGRSLTLEVRGIYISRSFLFCLLFISPFFLFFLSTPRDHLSLYAGNYVLAITRARVRDERRSFNRISRDLSRKFVANACSQAAPPRYFYDDIKET